MESSASGPLDATELLLALSRHEVDSVLIGGTAMQVHGHVRTTQDVDIVAAWTAENMRSLAAALGELGAALRGVDADLLGIDLSDPRQLHDGGNFLMHTRFGDLDVFASEQTPGAPPYEQLRARAIPVQIRGVRLLVAHPEDLIRMKSAAATFRDRPEAKRRQDLDDIAVLERLGAIQDAASAARLVDQTRSETPNRTIHPERADQPRPGPSPRKRPEDPRHR